MKMELFSLRMRASKQGRHISGAERVLPASEVGNETAQLVTRAMRAGQIQPDEIHCRVEAIDPNSIHIRSLPDIRTWQVPDWQTGRSAAQQLLTRAGVSVAVASDAIMLLAKGPAPGGDVMRGAMLLDANNGERLESDPGRGVRVSRMDFVPELREQISAQLEEAGLGHQRVKEALVLSGKVLGATGIIAELCWSDSPVYTTGYVADPVGGYQRISQLKPWGHPCGGRAFFVKTADFDLSATAEYLERQVVLFNTLGVIHQPKPWEEFR